MNRQEHDITHLHLDAHQLSAESVIPEGRTVEFSAVPPPGAVLSLWIGQTLLEPFLRPNARAWHWRWTAPQAAGSYPLRLRTAWPDGRVEEQQHTLRVLPRKLDQERYTALLADLQALGDALVFALSGGTEAMTLTAAPPQPAARIEEFHRLFGSDWERFAAAVERLAHRPPDRLHPVMRQTRLGQLRSVVRVRSIHPERDTAQVVTSTASYDAYEARLLRRLLDLLWLRLARLMDPPPMPEALAERAAEVRARLCALRDLPLVRDVPPLRAYRGPTPRLLRDPEYRVVYRFWQRLRRRAQIRWDSETLALPIAELPRLYERWCAVRVALELLELPDYTPVAHALLHRERDGWRLGLPEDAPLVVVEDAQGRQVRLRYHPRYRPLDSHTASRSCDTLHSLDRHARVPDLALELVRAGAPVQVAALDAKYRLDADGDIPAEALADAYSYLGAIGAPDGKRAAIAAALLYPGQGAAQHYPSGVAVLPLLPGNEESLRAWLSFLL